MNRRHTAGVPHLRRDRRIFERQLIRERTQAGLKAARAGGRLGRRRTAITESPRSYDRPTSVLSARTSRPARRRCAEFAERSKTTRPSSSNAADSTGLMKTRWLRGWRVTRRAHTRWSATRGRVWVRSARDSPALLLIEPSGAAGTLWCPEPHAAIAALGGLCHLHELLGDATALPARPHEQLPEIDRAGGRRPGILTRRPRQCDVPNHLVAFERQQTPNITSCKRVGELRDLGGAGHRRLPRGWRPRPVSSKAFSDVRHDCAGVQRGRNSGRRRARRVSQRAMASTSATAAATMTVCLRTQNARYGRAWGRPARRVDLFRCAYGKSVLVEVSVLAEDTKPGGNAGGCRRLHRSGPVQEQVSRT